ncbi:MAG TPA: tetratricopeptide repeat protein [Bacteroidota bacterium]|nr:tetratricopeptide repeat protein [Bacteroidota bacterium]
MRVIVACLLVPFLLSAQSLDDGKREFGKGNIAGAKKIFEQVLSADDRNAEAHYQLGLVYLGRQFRDDDEAVDQMEKAVDLNPNSADYQYGYGAALGMKTQNAGVFKQAFLAPKVKSAFLKATELNPAHVQAHLALAQYYLRAPGIMGGDTEKGWQEVETAIKLDEYLGRMTKSRLLQSEKRLPEAENELKTLTSSMPRDWRVWKSIGYFYYQQKRNDDAAAAMNRYVALRPDTADSHKSLAEVQLQNGDADAALASLKKALLLDKDFVTAVYLLGKTYEAKGMKNEARESYRRVLELNPGDNLRKLAEQNLKDLS